MAGDGPGAADGIGSVREFGERLTALRESAGLTIRDLAKAVGVPTSTLGDYFAGRHLPPVRRPELLTALLRECGVVDEAVHRAWADAVRRLRHSADRGTGAAAPYRGLASFRTEDAEWFFGREELVRTLVDRLASVARSGTALLCVVGPSGSGKSSILQAGLIPALLQGLPGVADSEHRPVLTFSPGRHPLRRLTELLAAADGTQRTAQLVIVIDQFEEVFTSCADAAEREKFIDALHGLATRVGKDGTAGAADRDALVVLGLRADFYGQALRHRQLATALQEAQVVVGPMTPEQVRRAIEQPARRAGIHLGEGLVDLLLRDLAPVAPVARSDRPAHDSGALPLLSHTLLAAWSISRRGHLTIDDYHRSGGIRDAVAHTAETVFENLPPAERGLARRLFLRMVHITEGAADTRRRMPREELLTAWAPDDHETAERVIARFIEQRLVTADTKSVEITHEALITAWPRLRSWLDTDRAGLVTHRRLADAAETWDASGRDPGTLYRGLRLATALEWSTDPAHADDLTPRERGFLTAGFAQEEAEREAARRQVRRRRRLIATLSVTVVLMTLLASYAVHQQHQSDTARRAALSRQAASEAAQLRGNDTALAAQLSVAAYRTAHTSEALGALLDTYVTRTVTRAVGPSGVMETVAVTSDATVMATGGDSGTVQLWHLPAHGAARPVGSPIRTAGAVYSVSFDPAGRTLAVAGAHGVQLWRIVGGSRTVGTARLPGAPDGTVYSVAFSPDGRLLAAAGADNQVRVWGLSATGVPHAPQVLRGASDAVHTLAFSPDGKLLASGSADRRIRLWTVTDPGRPKLSATLTGPTGRVLSLAFSPDGGTLAAGDSDSATRLWRLKGTGTPTAWGAPLTGPGSWVSGLRFAPDGHALAAASSDNKVWLWSLPDRTLTGTLPHPGPVTGLTFTGNGRRLVTSASDGVARLWNLDGPVLPGATGRVFSLLFLPRHELLVGASGPSSQLWRITDPQRPERTGTALVAPDGSNGWSGAAATAGNVLALGAHDGTVHLWDLTAPDRPVALATLTGSRGVAEVLAVSPDRRLLAVGADDSRVLVWDISRPRTPRLVARLPTSADNYVFGLAFSPHGRLLAAAGVDRTVRLWDVSDPNSPQRLGGSLTGPRNYVYSLAFGPDGHTLAAGSADGTVRLWDLSRPTSPRRLGSPLAGPRNYVYAVAFSPDGRTLAAAGGDGTVHLWSTAGRPTVLTTLSVSTLGVFAVAFDPANGMLATAGGDMNARLWELGPERVADSVCATAGTPLSRTEWQQYMPDSPYDPPC